MENRPNQNVQVKNAILFCGLTLNGSCFKSHVFLRLHRIRRIVCMNIEALNSWHLNSFQLFMSEFIWISVSNTHERNRNELVSNNKAHKNYNMKIILFIIMNMNAAHIKKSIPATIACRTHTHTATVELAHK